MKFIKENSIIKKAKELFDNKKNRGIVLLIFWFLFFWFVIIFFRNNAKNTPIVEKKSTVMEMLENIKNYTFTYEILQDDFIYNITGNYINNETVLNVEDKKYFIKDKTYIIDNEQLDETDDLFELEFWKISILNIYSLLKDKESLYETEIDNIKKTVYRISIAEFSEIFDKEIQYNDYIDIIIETNENDYNSIYIDLTKYMNYEELRYRNYAIKIALESINEVTQSSYSTMIKGE